MSKIERICNLLDKEYGKQVWAPHNAPLDELVLTILSQNTTGSNCMLAFSRLKEHLGDWEQVMDAEEAQIADAIRPAGLGDIRAARIKQILQQIYKKQGNLDLSWLERTDPDEARSYLLQFKGVGLKTAACVLLFSLGRPVLPVDTHVYRVSVRLGLIPGSINVERAHDVLQEMVPDERIYSFHINMVTHGRRVCKAPKPLCDKCVLREDCDYFAFQNRTA